MGPLQDLRSARSDRNDGWNQCVREQRLPNSGWPSSWPCPPAARAGKVASEADWNAPADKRIRTIAEPETMKEDTNGEEDAIEVEQPVAQTEQEILAPEPSKKNPFKGVPYFPTSAFGSPKLALNSLYGKEMGNVSLPNTALIFWDDNGPAHLCKHTCVFVCPVTHELFAAGHQEDSSKYIVVNDKGIVWYTKKKLAEHGAAARYYDCYVYRKHCALDPKAQPQGNFGLEFPYQLGQGPPILVPPGAEEESEAVFQQWKREAEMLAEKERTRKLALEQEAADEKEAIQDRQAYRDQRMVNLELGEVV